MKLLRLALLLGIAVAVLAIAWSLAHEAAATVGPREDTEVAAPSAPASAPSLAQQATLTAPQRAPATMPESGPAARDSAGSGRIRARVADTQERPIEGALVATFEDSKPGSVRTDSDGRCVLDVKPGGGSLRVHVDAPGFFHIRAYYQRWPELGFKLFRAMTLVGSVRDRDSGVPVAGATVRSPHGSCKGAAGGADGRCPPDATRTDERGTFTLAGVPAGTGATIVINANGYPSQVSTLTFSDRGDRLEHVFEIRRGVWATGRVVDWSTGTPVSQAKVGIGYGDDEVTTGTDGSFRVLLLPEADGHVDLCVTAQNYCDLRGPVTDSEIRSGAEVQLRLPRSVPIAGLVHDREGRPVRGAIVDVGEDHQVRSPKSVERKDLEASLRTDWSVASENRHTSRTKTDAEGRFQTSGLTPWSAAHLLSVKHYEHLPSEYKVPAIGGPGETVVVDVVLESKGPCGSVAGRLSVNGVPSEGPVGWKGRTQAGTGRAGADGEFRIEGVEVGDVQITATPAGYERVYGPQREKLSARCRLVVAANIETRVELDAAITSGTIRGRVSHRDGRPAAAKQVSAVGGGGLRGTASSGPDGSYELQVPSIGERFRVGVSHPYTESRKDVIAGATGVDFVLTDLGRIRYRAVDSETGKPVASFDLFLGTAGEDRSPRMESHDAPDPQGFRVLQVPPGRYDLEVSAEDPEYRPALLRDVHVAAEQTKEVSVSLQRGAVLVLRLPAEAVRLPEDGLLVVLISAEEAAKIKDAAELQLAAMPLPGRHRPPARPLRFDAKGATVLRGLAPGTYRLLTPRKGLVFEPDSVEVPDAGERIVELKWRLQRD